MKEKRTVHLKKLNKKVDGKKVKNSINKIFCSRNFAINCFNKMWSKIKNFAFGKTLKGRLNKKEKIKYPYFNKWLKLIEFDTEYATVFNNLLFESRKNYSPFQTISKKNRLKLSNPLNQFTHGQNSIVPRLLRK